MNDEPVMIPPVAEAPLLAYQNAPLPRVPAEWTNVRVFAYRPEAVKEAVWRTVILQACVSLPMIAVAMIVGVWRTRLPLMAILPTEVAALGVFLVLFLFKLWRISYRIRGQWPTFRLVLADQGLLRTCHGFPDLAIEFAQVKKINETRRILMVRGESSRQTIMIAKQFVENVDEVRAALAAVRTIEPIRRAWLRIVGRIGLIFLIAAVSLGLLGWGMYSQQLGVELACAGGLLVYAGWSIWVAWRSPNISFAQKAGIFVTLLLPFLLFAKMGLHRLLHMP